MKFWSLNQARAWLCFVFFLCTLVFVRVYRDTPVFNIPSPADDTGYFAYTESILRGDRFNWCHPGVTDGWLRGLCVHNKKNEGREYAYNMYAPGPGVTLLPITAIGNLLNQWGIFTPKNIDPLLFWHIVGTFFLFCIGGLFLFEVTLYLLRDQNRAWWLSVLFLVGNPLLYFVMRRPLMSHAVEFFLFFSLAYFTLRAILSERPVVPALLAGLAAGLMMITRLNNVHIPALFGVLFLFWPGQKWSYRRMHKVAAYVIGALPPLLLFLWINYLQKGTFLYKTENYYEAYTIGFFLKVYLANFWQIFQWFGGIHWGIFLLMPLTAIQVWYVARNFKRICSPGFRREHLIPIILVGAIVAVHLNMMANGPSSMSYAYRYVFSYYYFLHLGFVWGLGHVGGLDSLETITGYKKWFQCALIVSALIGTLHIQNYESRVPGLRPNLRPAHEEGFRHPFWRDTTIWTTPKFAVHSYREMLSGNPILALVGSPLAAYPIMALRDSFVGSLPGMAIATDYYRSKNRNVFFLSDLVLLYQFELLFGLMALISALLSFSLRSLLPDQSRT